MRIMIIILPLLKIKQVMRTIAITIIIAVNVIMMFIMKIMVIIFKNLKSK